MLQLEVVGEKTEAGVLVRFSPLNILNPGVQAYALRLECTNGATSQNSEAVTAEGEEMAGLEMKIVSH
jgi:hypothetical protein